MELTAGKLNLRCNHGVPEKLLFSKSDVGSWRLLFSAEYLARISDAKWIPDLRHGTDYPVYYPIQPDDHDLITYREPTDEELVEIFKNWDPKNSLGEWATKVLGISYLLLSEKDRISALSAPYIPAENSPQ